MNRLYIPGVLDFGLYSIGWFVFIRQIVRKNVGYEAKGSNRL